jgi:lactate permease
MKNSIGGRHVYAAFYGVLDAFLVTLLVFCMPITTAVSAFTLGTLRGFLSII